MKNLLLFTVVAFSLVIAGCIHEPASPTTPKNQVNSQPPIVQQTTSADRNANNIFLVSSENWREALQLVPVAIWTQGGTIEKRPLFIVPQNPSEEYNSQIARFAGHYNPNKIIAVGAIPTRLTSKFPQLVQVSPAELLSYWQNVETLVYVEDNYETALLATTYASLLGAPLVIKGGSLDLPSTFTGKKVVTVGNTQLCPSNANCVEQYTLQQLQEKYNKVTNTDKMILVNPSDENQDATSLSAAVLAAGKHELLISTSSTNHEDIDTTIAEAALQKKFNYLTIMSSPKFVPMSTTVMIKAAAGRAAESLPYEVDLDNRFYATLGENLVERVDLATGRIWGEGASIYVVRALFFDELPKTHNNALIAMISTETDAEKEATKTGEFSSGQGTQLWNSEIKNAVQASFPNLVALWGDGVNTITSAEALSQEERSKIYSESNFFYYHGHGNENGIYSFALNNKNLPDLNYPFIVTTACSTCRSINVADPFCTRNLLKGAMGYIGSFEDGVNMGYVNSMLTDMYVNGLTMGEVIKNAKNLKMCSEPIESCIYEKRGGNMRHVLIGDPTLKAKWW